MADGNGASAPVKAVEKVKMTDGREVDFAGKKKMLKSSIIEGNTVKTRIDFRNGETRLFTCPAELVLKAAAHGLEQKYGDSTAGESDVDDMILAVDDTDSHIQKGEWNATREGGGFAGTSVLAQALVEVSGKTADEIKAFLKDKTQAEKMALRNSPKVKPTVDKIEAAKAAKNTQVDTNALLAGIGA